MNRNASKTLRSSLRENPKIRVNDLSDSDRDSSTEKLPLLRIKSDEILTSNFVFPQICTSDYRSIKSLP